MAEKTKEDKCAHCEHARGSHGVGMCLGEARAVRPGERPQRGCERNCKAFVEKSP